MKRRDLFLAAGGLITGAALAVLALPRAYHGRQAKSAAGRDVLVTVAPATDDGWLISDTERDALLSDQ